MEDPKFLKTELKVTASEELEREVEEELKNYEEKSIASIIKESYESDET